MNKPVIITIDTEGHKGKDPITHLIFGKTDKGVGGIEKLMDIFDSHNVKGLFFVDIAEAWDYGKKKIASVLNCISERGHNTGVHIHPNHMADINRPYLWQYTLEEQKDIITKCTNFYKQVTGKKPLSFRAGRYGADNNTLQVLNELGYKYDMSEFYGNRYCHINPHQTCNKVVKYDGITEIPVTAYKSFSKLGYFRFDKFDISLAKGELKWLINHIKEDSSIDVCTFFVHSFSLLKWRKDPDFPHFLKTEEDKLSFILGYMKKMGFNFIKEDDLEILTINQFNPLTDITDYSNELITLWYFIRRAYSFIKMRFQNFIYESLKQNKWIDIE